jgi:hypothetical protein
MLESLKMLRPAELQVNGCSGSIVLRVLDTALST